MSDPTVFELYLQRINYVDWPRVVTKAVPNWGGGSGKQWAELKKKIDDLFFYALE